MVISIVMRKTDIKDASEWRSRLDKALTSIRAVLESEPGFAGVQYLRGTEDDGETAQITTWQTLEDCRRYVREGGAATVGAYEDRALPTASHPDGTWVRKTFEIVETG